MTFIRVDLPAPFSPNTAWISPGMTRKDTASLATTDGYRLVMPANLNKGSGIAGADGIKVLGGYQGI
jgi:hypothetical protein